MHTGGKQTLGFPTSAFGGGKACAGHHRENRQGGCGSFEQFERGKMIGQRGKNSTLSWKKSTSEEGPSALRGDQEQDEEKPARGVGHGGTKGRGTGNTPLVWT